MSQPVLCIRNLNIDYVGAETNFHAVGDVSFDIAPGEFFGLAGESGCGKSTIAFAISRLHRPPALIRTGSVIEVNGRNVLDLDDADLRSFRWREVAMVFQSAMNSLNPVLTVFEQFRDMLARHEKLGRDAARAKAGEMLAMVGISEDRLDSFPHQLSGGMRQRVVLAMALTLRPRLIVMDEPTTALDVVVQREILQEIVALRKTLGFSVLFITHDLALMAQFADRIAIMLEGRIVEEGEARSLVAEPQHEYTRSLLAAAPGRDVAFAK